MKILLTGAASGIGKATVEKLLEKGHEVIGVDRDFEALEELDDRVEKHCFDIYDEQKVEELVEEADFEVLVNCAGYYELGSLEDMDSETVEKHFRDNVFGGLNMIRHSMPMLRGKNGRVVNVSSVVGKISMPFFGVYSGTKHSIEAFSDALRMETEPFDVEVVVVEPGPVNTGFNKRARQALEKYVPESVYSERYEKALESDRLKGVSAEKAAETVVKAIETRNPKNRYTVTWQAWLAPKLKTLLPEKLWDTLISRSSY